MIKKIMWAIGGGAVSFYTEFGLTILFTEVFHWNPELSYFIAIIFGLLILFYIFRTRTFKVEEKTHKQAVRFFILYIIYYAVNWSLVVLLLRWIPYYFAIIIINLLTWPPTFLANNYWVFKSEDGFQESDIFKQIKRDFSDEWNRIFSSHRRRNYSDNPKHKYKNIKHIKKRN